MFDMFVREYFDNSLIPLSDTIEAFVFRRDNLVQAWKPYGYQDKSCTVWHPDVVCHPEPGIPDRSQNL